MAEKLVTKNDLLNKLRAYRTTPDDENIQYKKKIEKALMLNPCLLYALNEKSLESELFDDDGNINWEWNEETKEFRLCPIFDNGLSLLSDLNDYPLTDDLYTCIERVQAKPFDSDHVEQVTAAEQLYGRQLIFRISHGELRSELNLLSEAYSPDILQRAERVLLEQKRKHSWLF